MGIWRANCLYFYPFLQEIRLKYGFKLRLTDLLIKPIQRLTKYHMLLEAILKYSEKAGLSEEAGAISRAFHVMTVVPNQANDMMDIGRLQGFEVDFMALSLQRCPAFTVERVIDWNAKSHRLEHHLS